MSVYLVTRGEYSDYSVYGVYSTRERADEAAILFSGHNDQAGIEEFEMDALPKHPPGMLLYSVLTDIDGNVDVRRWPITDDIYLDMGPLHAYGDGEHMTLAVWAKNDAHAAKVINEQRVKAIAGGTWLVRA